MEETLEEAAKRLYPVVIKSILDVYDDGVSNQIGEEDINENNRESFIDGAKWQQKRMYSEGEVEKITKELFFTMANCDKRIIHKESDFNKWLVEQFKKK